MFVRMEHLGVLLIELQSLMKTSYAFYIDKSNLKLFQEISENEIVVFKLIS